jgi:broad specificity phosphatase PhoE
MEIYIMRHGEPDVSMISSERIKSEQFLDCLQIYNRSGLLSSSRPDASTIERFKGFSAVVSSDLKRSIDSALLLCAQRTLIVDALFREVEAAFLTIPVIRFTRKTWGNIFILLWLIGLFEHKKAFREAKTRAKFCVEKLVKLADEHERVLYVGHGFINTYIVKELISLGWEGPKRPNKQYWGYDVYKNKKFA